MFPKHAHIGFFKKGYGSRLLGVAKGIASVLDEPIFQAGIMGVAPEIGVPLVAAKKYGLLEKVKRI
jgi:hypothetical protein